MKDFPTIKLPMAWKIDMICPNKQSNSKSKFQFTIERLYESEYSKWQTFQQTRTRFPPNSKNLNFTNVNITNQQLKGQISQIAQISSQSEIRVNQNSWITKNWIKIHNPTLWILNLKICLRKERVEVEESDNFEHKTKPRNQTWDGFVRIRHKP